MEVLFTFLAERYERTVTITSNLVFSEWDRIFKDRIFKEPNDHCCGDRSTGPPRRDHCRHCGGKQCVVDHTCEAGRSVRLCPL